MAMTAFADDFKLQSYGDSLAYAFGIVFVEDEDEEFSEYFKNGAAQILAGVEQAIAGAGKDETDLEGKSKSYAAGAMYGIFTVDGLEHGDGTIIVKDLVEGMKDGVARNYSRMDTVECRKFLKKFKPSKADNASLKKASYAMGIMRTRSNDGISEAMNEYDIPKEEQNIQEFWDGYISTVEQAIILAQSPLKTEEMEEEYFIILGKKMGSLFISVCSTLKSEGITASPQIIFKGFKDKLTGQPLLISEEKAFEMVNQLDSDHEEETDEYENGQDSDDFSIETKE